MELPVYMIGVITAVIVAMVDYLSHVSRTSKEQQKTFDISGTVRQASIAGVATVVAILSTKYLAPYIGSSSKLPTVLLDAPKFE